MDDDAVLVRAAQADPRAFAALYRRYLAPVYRYIYYRIGSQKDAEDLASQVFLAALEALPGYDEQGRFAAWLFSIAHRKLVAFYRRQRISRLRSPWLAEPGDEVLEQVARREDLSKIGRLVAKLTRKEQELLHLRFTAGLDYREIAQVLGKKEGAVRMAVHRAVERLRQEWENTP